MKNVLLLLAFCCTILSPAARAYIYPLQFSPNPNYRGLVVAGYGFNGETIVGNCSYDTSGGASGRGQSPLVYRVRHYRQTCTWDLLGNLLSITPGEPAAPAPLYVDGTKTVYALGPNGAYTGADSSLPNRGFVNSPGAHYSWVTSQDLLILLQVPYTFVLTLKSDGDVPLNIAGAEVSAVTGTASIQASSCTGAIAVSAKCSITVAYVPPKGSYPTGLKYDTFRIGLTSDAGEAVDFVQKFVIRVPVGSND